MRRNTILMAGSIVMILGVGPASGQIVLDPEDEEVGLTPRPWLSNPGNSNVEPDPGFNPDPPPPETRPGQHPPRGAGSGSPNEVDPVTARKGWAGLVTMDLQPRPDSVPGEGPGARRPTKGDPAGRPSEIGGPNGIAGPNQIVRPDQGWTGKSDPPGKGKGGHGVDDSGKPKGGKTGGGKTTPRPQGADAGSPSQGDPLAASKGWAGLVTMDLQPRPDAVPGGEPGAGRPSKGDPSGRPMN